MDSDSAKSQSETGEVQIPLDHLPPEASATQSHPNHRPRRSNSDSKFSRVTATYSIVKKRVRGFSVSTWGTYVNSRTSSSDGVVFCEGQEQDSCNHRKIGAWEATVIMVAETISLGILNLSYAVATLGLVPGSILIFAVGGFTIYTGHVIWQFKMRYPELKNFPDAAQRIGGPIARWIVEAMVFIFLLFVQASHLVIFAKMANTFAYPKLWQCTVVFTVIGTLSSMVGTMPRTLKAARWGSIASCLSITAATLATVIGLAVKHHKVEKYAFTPLSVIAAKGTEGPWPAVGLALNSIIVAFTGHIAYFNIIGEMKKPERFPIALYATNAFTIGLYFIAGFFIYYLAGQDVPSPALSAAIPLVQKIAYGLAIPTIYVAGVIAALVANKRVYDIVWRKEPQVIHEKSTRARASWYAIISASWILAFILANVIPFFASLLGLIGALVGTWLCLGFPAIFWLYMTWDREDRPDVRDTIKRHLKGQGSAPRKNVFLSYVFVVTLVLCIGCMFWGLWGAAVDIQENSKGGKAFSCDSNLNLTSTVPTDWHRRSF